MNLLIFGLIFTFILGLTFSLFAFPRILEALKERRSKKYDEYVRYCIKNNIRYY